jgi:hypothetical protein
MSTSRPVNDTLADESAAVAAVAAALVQPYDVIGVIVDILTAAAHTTGATAGGLILRRLAQDRLQLLAATSHRAEELELYQAQHEQGPCFDAVETGEHITATSASEMARRWPMVADAFHRAGVEGVHAVPLSWNGEVIGALNLFFAAGHTSTGRSLQVFADLATLSIVHASPVSPTQVLGRTRSALDERTVLEQAKGVLAQQKGLGMDAAYDLLLHTAQQGNELLAAAAARLVDEAGQGR